MVSITRALLSFSKPVRSSRYDQNYVDRVRLYVRGGNGGNGVPRIGGIGGAGGSVTITADAKIKDMKQILRKFPTKRVVAGDGGHSRKTRLLGEMGANVHVQVPLGVTVTLDNHKVLRDLVEVGQSVTVARGGPGGTLASNFLGGPGDRLSVRLNLKLLGDVGLVGFPNAGKSTLLKAISRARPKIASYPFTTIKPNLGICQMEDLRRISFADLPGLIEGAHENIGMGHSFLKHVERTRVLMFVVDINGFQFKPNLALRSALETILILNRELEFYNEDLLDKPAICVLSKMDSKGAEGVYEKLQHDLKNIEQLVQDSGFIDPDCLPNRFINFVDIVPVSAKFSPKSIKELKYRVRDVIDFADKDSDEGMMQQLADDVQNKLENKTKLV